MLKLKRFFGRHSCVYVCDVYKVVYLAVCHFGSVLAYQSLVFRSKQEIEMHFLCGLKALLSCVICCLKMCQRILTVLYTTVQACLFYSVLMFTFLDALLEKKKKRLKVILIFQVEQIAGFSNNTWRMWTNCWSGYSYNELICLKGIQPFQALIGINNMLAHECLPDLFFYFLNLPV